MLLKKNIFLVHCFFFYFRIDVFREIFFVIYKIETAILNRFQLEKSAYKIKNKNLPRGCKSAYEVPR